MDFSLILFVALVLTGVVALWDRLLGSGKRTNVKETNHSAISDTGELATKEKAGSSIIVEYARAFFPVILFAFLKVIGLPFPLLFFSSGCLLYNWFLKFNNSCLFPSLNSKSESIVSSDVFVIKVLSPSN